ncbi:Na+-transporting NADH:ubiquinone oxidoreductase subunit NqrC [Candidatus Scalindua japonica]|uniref:Na+-transporting NADH:ubiquinone oxidoreductase subunit NqrC n=1 Tax=Candidatus Scalindua japonica TaxID=1284222 RepID=A0A286TXG2_9BACT|nr:FMN-binding protein [Candidatus Scalindua japonica]GAX60578.1 Na+-transporting NADH:ubiquinone oxidoreductase subunit NqrC [Candidatus Scalindua japonica]
MNEFKIILIRVFSITLITAIPCAILLSLYFVTSEKIAEYHEIKLKRSVLDIFAIPYHSKEKQFFGIKQMKIDKEDVRKVFSENISRKNTSDIHSPKQSADPLKMYKKGKELFLYYKEGSLEGVGFITTKLGYGFNKAADISLFICVGPDLETIKGIEVLDHTETPGLGGRMTENKFKKQFVGKKLRPRLLLVRGRKTVGPNEVHAITGASYTSKGMEKIINEAMKTFWQEMEAKSL